MKVIKKVWPEFFRKIKSCDRIFQVRLADFKIKKGDVFVLMEWNPKTKKYTGRKVTKKVGSVLEIPKDMRRFYSEKDIKRYGLYVMELD